MKRILVAIFVLAATACGAAASGPPLQQWLAQTNGFIKDQQVAIHGMKLHQSRACSLPTSVERRAACNAGYDAVVALRYAIIAQFQLRLTAVQLDPASQNFILTDIAPPQEMDRMRNSVNDEWLKVWRMFPDPTYKPK